MQALIDKYLAQEKANNEERRALHRRHTDELRELNERHRCAQNPFKIALGRDYCRENVQVLAQALRALRRD
jgi:hypothetical protein